MSPKRLVDDGLFHVQAHDERGVSGHVRRHDSLVTNQAEVDHHRAGTAYREQRAEPAGDRPVGKPSARAFGSHRGDSYSALASEASELPAGPLNSAYSAAQAI